LPFLIKMAEADHGYAKSSVEGKRAAEQAIARIMLDKAESDYSGATFRLEDLRQRQPQLEREVEALQARVSALTSQLELLIDETRRVENAQAQLSAAEAMLEEAQIAVENAQLTLDRTTVRVPRSGRVLQLVAHPGTRVMGLEEAGMQNSSIVIRCYDPQSLQVRADVRLEDVPFVQPGQPVEIETASSPHPIIGTVLLATSSANIQKNTLEVKVAIIDPPAAIRPEMLVTATFLAMPQPDQEATDTGDYDRLLVPRQLVISAEGEDAVWVATPDGRAQRKTIQLGRAGSEELVEVVQGLLPTDKVISSDRGNLSPGARIVITEEDPTIGMMGQL
ncbi:MAG: efflux RND transporter periplasmic adaptor subunit, partial [Pirellulaceae bacterium]